MARIALGVEYDGRCFEGWQTQPHHRTVQDVLESALTTIADGPVSTACAGRTDSGVHATAQVVHFDTVALRPPSAWVRGVNAHLPDSMAVTWVREVGDDFHARFMAERRHYRYWLLNRSVRPGVLTGRVGWYHGPLDEGRMAEAARSLVGEHDFSSFRAAGCQAKSPVRRMDLARVERRGALLCFDFAANAFLHHMVRNLVGALVYVGKGRQPPGWIADLLAVRDRGAAAPTFAAEGLYLCGVEYPRRWSLPDDGRIICRPEFLLG